MPSLPEIWMSMWGSSAHGCIKFCVSYSSYQQLLSVQCLKNSVTVHIEDRITIDGKGIVVRLVIIKISAASDCCFNLRYINPCYMYTDTQGRRRKLRYHYYYYYYYYWYPSQGIGTRESLYTQESSPHMLNRSLHKQKGVRMR